MDFEVDVYDKFNIDQEQYLAHYARKGQKWGVRNGPPYPLSREVVARAYGRYGGVPNDGGKGKDQQNRDSSGNEKSKGQQNNNFNNGGKGSNQQNNNPNNGGKGNSGNFQFEPGKGAKKQYVPLDITLPDDRFPDAKRLSNEDMERYIRRLQLEKQYNQAVIDAGQKVKRKYSEIIRDQASTTMREVTSFVVSDLLTLSAKKMIHQIYKLGY